MKKYFTYLTTGLLLLLSTGIQADVVTELQAQYAQRAKDSFSATTGEAIWKQGFSEPKSGRERSCALCHTTNLNNLGKHARTGKKIEPMAPSANPSRLSDVSKVKKWFKRNCKWTMGRECTAQEKGDLLAFISSQ